MSKVKDFKQEEENVVCSWCGCTIKKSKRCRIRISTTNAGKRYKGSNKPFMMNYIINCCQECFDKLNYKILAIQNGR